MTKALSNDLLKKKIIIKNTLEMTLSQAKPSDHVTVIQIEPDICMLDAGKQ